MNINLKENKKENLDILNFDNNYNTDIIWYSDLSDDAVKKDVKNFLIRIRRI